MTSPQRKYRNTFAPYVENKELSLEAIIKMLYWGLSISQLPSEIQHDIRQEMERRKRLREGEWK